ncbi:MAG: response regulator [Arcobacter sp.]|jgi:DNA-binding response OmpR family regulator|uniref:response regulator n=1 Tax=Arcobacter sp. TaxID=1872629 RepID=UPI002A76152B|nr:response regulator [Arcobacter sp.]MDY3200565.1 response regulator [Arcobacter sp.]
MNSVKILIIEDEAIVALDVKRILTNLGQIVINCVSNYEKAIESIKENRPELIFSDINLGKGKDGIEIIEEIQKNDFIPVIYLTAYSDEETIQRAIKTNPLGYILKPFKKEDIKSTLLLSLYKLKTQTFNKNNSYEKLGDDYFYDLENEILFFKTKPIKLSIKEKQLLTLLVEAKGQIVSFKYIEYFLWPDAPICDSTLRTLIYRLRTKLNYKIIETISSIGCRISNSS